VVDVIVPFVTGLTTGGLSCLAVQGGLLATSIAHQTETEVQQELAAKQAARPARQPQTAPTESVQRHADKRHARQEHKHRHAHQARVVRAIHAAATQAPVQKAEAAPIAVLPSASSAVHKHAAKPILIFLGAKLVIYTILGALLGALGSVLQLTPAMRAIIQIAIGAFMVGTALNMLKVHPIFRNFAIEPPKSITRYIRRVAKNSSDDVITPAFLGALTVFIPCGVTQTMMALAITSGDPLSGALIMFSFTIGSSPLFFALAYLARKLGEKMEARFLRFAAVLVLILGLVAVDSGLNLMGSPLSLSALLDSTASAVLTPSGRQVSAANLATADADNVATITVYPNSYLPNRIRAQAGKPARLKLITNRTYG